MSDDIAAFIRARLDEDEQTARAATPGPWQVDDPSYVEAIHAPDGTSVVAGGRWGDEGPCFETSEDALHLARHDPARVLRELEAKRRLLDRIFWYESRIDAEWGCCHSEAAIAAGECKEWTANGIAALRDLAAVWADHPGYREEWRP